MKEAKVNAVLYYTANDKDEKEFGLEVVTTFDAADQYVADGHEPATFNLDDSAPIQVLAKVRAEKGGSSEVTHDGIVLGTPSQPRDKWEVEVVVVDEEGNELGKNMVVFEGEADIEQR